SILDPLLRHFNRLELIDALRSSALTETGPEDRVAPYVGGLPFFPESRYVLRNLWVNVQVPGLVEVLCALMVYDDNVVVRIPEDKVHDQWGVKRVGNVRDYSLLDSEKLPVCERISESECVDRLPKNSKRFSIR